MEFETFKEELLDHLRQILGEEKKNLLSVRGKEQRDSGGSSSDPGGREADCPYHLSPGVF